MAVKFELPLTQNSTVVAFLCALLVAIAITFEFELEGQSFSAIFIRLAHLGTFSTWLGVQVWVTFFAGITMYRHLPRHTFGFIQGKLFPKYFMLGTVLSSVTLLTYVIQNPFTTWKWQQKMQGFALIMSCVSALCNMLYFEPQTTACTMNKHKYEREVNAGQTIGKLDEDKLAELRKIPEYVRLEKKFFSLHTYSAIANLLSLAAQAVHLWHLTCYLSSI